MIFSLLYIGADVQKVGLRVPPTFENQRGEKIKMGCISCEKTVEECMNFKWWSTDDQTAGPNDFGSKKTNHMFWSWTGWLTVRSSMLFDLINKNKEITYSSDKLQNTDFDKILRITTFEVLYGISKKLHIVALIVTYLCLI